MRYLPVRIRLCVPLFPELTHMGIDPIKNFPLFVAIELTVSRNDATILQGNRNSFTLTPNMNMRNPFDSVISIMSMDEVRDTIRGRNRHSQYLQKIICWGLYFKKSTHKVYQNFLKKST